MTRVPPNKGMKLPKPAQAMELRSLSPVFGGPGGRDEGGSSKVLGVLSLLLVSAPYTVAAAYEQPTLNFPSALEALQEPDWAKASSHDRVFRFIWFPVLTTQRLICVRAEWSASGPRAVA